MRSRGDGVREEERESQGRGLRLNKYLLIGFERREERKGEQRGRG